VSLPGYNPASPEALQAFAKHAWRKGNIAGMLTRYRGEPTLVLFHADKMGRSFGIQQSRIDLYVDFETGSARLALAAKAQEAARHMGIDPIDANVNAIMDMIMFQAEDLKKMPRGQEQDVVRIPQAK
jgi:hypothetical protein